MREIKFRGKNILGGGWVYGDLVRVSGFGTHHTEIYRDGVDEQHSPEVDPATVGQYTGLKDKNGVEIYEGDLIEFKSGRFTNFGNTPTGKHSVHVDVIEWMGSDCSGRGRGCWGVRMISADSFNEHKLGSPVSSAIHVPIHLYGEVIGNIHSEIEK